MTIAPMVEPEKTRLHFRRMKELFELVKAEKIPGVKMEWLSMGMIFLLPWKKDQIC